jgi:hypothetical protein
VTAGLIERSDCTEAFTSKSSRIPTTEFLSIVIGNGVLEIVAVMGLMLGMISQTELAAHVPIAVVERFTAVSTAFPNVSVRLAYVSGATFVRLRNAVSVCKCPNSTSVGVESTETAGLVISVGCSVAPVIKASKNRTATLLGGVSPIVRLIGTPPFVDEALIDDPPQDTRRVQLVTTSATKITFRMY